MELNKQVTSLPISRRLKELGVKQESYFAWNRRLGEDKYFVVGGVYESSRIFNQRGDDCVSAFSASELGTMLPVKVTDNGVGYFLRMLKDRTVESKQQFWRVFYESDESIWLHVVQGDTLPDAMGRMLIHLLESRLITSESLEV